jgi:hypothetical protein
MTQRKLFDFPTETRGRGSPQVRERSRSGGSTPPSPTIVYTPRHREVPEVAVVSQEEAERAREIKKREIEYHKMRMER